MSRTSPHLLDDCPSIPLSNPSHWTLTGHSRAGERTGLWLDPLKIALDSEEAISSSTLPLPLRPHLRPASAGLLSPPRTPETLLAWTRVSLWTASSPANRGRAARAEDDGGGVGALQGRSRLGPRDVEGGALAKTRLPSSPCPAT